MSKSTLPSEETFKKVFASILAGVSKETKEKYPEVIGSLAAMSMDEFDCFINYPIGNCIQAFHKSDDGAFIYEYFRYVENAFTNYIVGCEGSCCSVDKSRHIVRKLHKFFEEGVVFDLVKTKPEEYWKTECLTAKDCMDFYEAIKSAFFGNHVKLVQFYLEKSRKDN